MAFMSNFTVVSGIAMGMLVAASLSSVVSLATNYWEDVKPKIGQGEFQVYVF